jgi:hypothetical protein
MTLRRAREVLRRLVGLDKLNRVARLTGALQEICRLDPREGYTLSDAARIAEDGLANPPDYIWPVRSEPERDVTCTCGHDGSNHATHGLRSCCRSTAEGECDCPGFTAQNPSAVKSKEKATHVMGHCKDCRHWAPSDFPSGLYPQVQACSLADSRHGAPFINGERSAPRLSCAMDSGDIQAELLTWANFGCVQFEAAEPDEAKEQAISDLLEKIANLPGITPADLELLEEITQPLNQTHK